MAKVFPEEFLPSSSSSSTSTSSSSSSSSSYVTSKREVFTIWMKSLVMNSNGCTVYDSKGQVVYRIDNYDHKCSNEVYLMDLKGKVLSTIIRKKLRFFGRWEGFISDGSKGQPWFQVRKFCKVLRPDSVLNVTVRREMDEQENYRMERVKGSKLSCKIVDQTGLVVAEVKPKQSSSGVVLGDDVLTLVVEPNVDHSLIMGLIVVHGLINRKL